ncbi:hypothetical protein K458DRAFT_152047 [Lentithecium fluviatile CBS 122367]|uniref:Mid2 domain-containing protein n=1 Tax=Lentithecium fluviatile CBS 122367 TaxID=1168545 RepID=A0A6G1JET9_9PLEO|nr:hypothetical protein K458DRAFT_152047 [Lentithecium fluviatile CBS 122367]
MKLQVYSIAAAALVAEAAAKTYTAPRSMSDSAPLDKRNLAARGDHLFARQSYEYCDSNSYYYCYGSTCCGITAYSCMPAGAECCAGISEYGLGLYCDAGTSCVIQNGLVQCENDSGETFTADSSTVEATSTTDGPTSTATDETSSTDTSDEPTSTGSSGSSSRKSSKKKSKAWIGGAVAGPLIGIAIIAGIVFLLAALKKKKAKADAASAAMANQQNIGGAPGGGQGQLQMTSAPMSPETQGQQPNMNGAYAPHPDNKSPAYTQQYEVPTPINSPPPQWTPASPPPPPISPMPMHAQPLASQPPQQQQYGNEMYGLGATTVVSPMSTGNGGGGYTQNMHQPQAMHQQGYGGAMELPTAPASQPARGGAQELHG